VHPRDVEETLERIDRLQSEYADLDYVARRAPELRFLRSRLAENAPLLRPADFEAAFGARRVELDPHQRRVRMEFAFDKQGPGGPWEQGDWIAAAGGWEAPGTSSREHLLEDARWPRLELGAPLDLDQPLSVVLRIEGPGQADGPELLLSVAGVHVALHGDAHDRGARPSIASGGTQELAKLLAGLSDDDDGPQAPTFVEGRSLEIRVDLTRGRGRAEVYLDRRLVAQEDRPRPSGDPGTASIVLRSLEPVRLVSAEISAGYRARP
jgi:hypothetical protein